MALGHLPKGRVKKVFGDIEFVKGPTMIQRSRAMGAEEKAVFHNLTGAGRSHVLRPFMDLTEEDQNVLTTQVADGIDRVLNEHGATGGGHPAR